jgi:lysophospholipase L1-like esterase
MRSKRNSKADLKTHSMVQPLESRLMMAATPTNLISTADATVRDGSYINTNYGKDASLAAQKSGSGFQRQSYVKFNLNTLQGSVDSAVLHIYGRLTAAGTASVPVAVMAVGENGWGETAITWTNRPAAGPSLGSLNLGTSYKWIDLDVSKYVADAKAANSSSVSFALIAQQNVGAQVLFNSHESTGNRPTLIVKTGTGTDPTPTVPAAPAGLTAELASGGVSLDWNASANATSYNVYRTDITNGGSAVKIATVAGTSYLDNGVDAATDYSYTVRAVNGAGEGNASLGVDITTDSDTDPNPQPQSGKPTFSALASPGLSVKFSAGQVKLPNGKIVNVDPGTLNFAPLPVQHGVYTNYAPQNWDGRPLNKRWGDASANLAPPIDTTQLGGPYHQVIPGSVVVQNGAGTKTYVKDVDYKLNIEWGQVGNLNGRLGVWKTGAVKISYDIVLQRIDLIELLPDGTMKVKQGNATTTVPVLPTVDAGAVALAGIHVNTLDGAVRSGFAIKQRDIYPIAPKPTVAPIRASTISKTINKLKAGNNINIAFFGDSITAGAEASGWFHNRDRTWTSLVSNAIEDRYGVNVTQTMAHESGISGVLGGPTWKKYVLQPNDAGKHVDLVIIAMGMNDFGKPSLTAYKNALRGYIADAKSRGIDVIMQTTIQSNPYYDPVIAGDHVARSVIAQAMRDVGAETGVAVADAYTEWVNQAYKGIAPVSQLHNWFNHPGNAGHKVIANAILPFFPG